VRPKTPPLRLEPCAAKWACPPAALQAMISVFAYCIMIINALGMAAVFSLPFVLRMQAHARYDSYGVGSMVDGFVQDQMRSAAPSLYASLMLLTLGMVAAIGVLKRRGWARRVWMVTCLLWLVVQILFAVWMPPWTFNDTSVLVFRLVVLYISVSILFGPDGRKEFLVR